MESLGSFLVGALCRVGIFLLEIDINSHIIACDFLFTAPNPFFPFH